MNYKPRFRFCPSPTGTPHVGLMRTALFNWVYSKHIGGTFVFRIEDTDSQRDSQDSYNQLIEAMKWLGLNWDEGVEIGGKYGPYSQSQRMGIYKEVVKNLIEHGYAYESYSTHEEIKARNLAAGKNEALGYDGYDRDLSKKEIDDFKAQGRKPVIRFRMPNFGKPNEFANPIVLTKNLEGNLYSQMTGNLVYKDLVRGEISFAANTVPDFVIVRANGEPLYTLVNPVDDILMGITHILRGEDLLSSMPRQLCLHQALRELGYGAKEVLNSGKVEFGHLPYVTGAGNKKLSKRDPESDLFKYKKQGFIPEGFVNYLALLGWSISGDRDIFSVDEMIEKFEISDVNPNPAQFDYKKALAINASHIRLLSEQDFFAKVIEQFELENTVVSMQSKKLLTKLCPLAQTRVQDLHSATQMLNFVLTEIPDYQEGLIEELDPNSSKEVLQACAKVLINLEKNGEFNSIKLQETLKGELIEKLGLKPKIAFSPLRAAICGRTVSPPLFEAMEFLGFKNSINRINHLSSIL